MKIYYTLQLIYLNKLYDIFYKKIYIKIYINVQNQRILHLIKELFIIYYNIF